MALSPNSRHRSRLIREMSRDLKKTAHSCASSTGSHHGTVSDSTISDFDPENEAIMSTRQLNVDFSQRLPELRDTAKKYGQWNGGRQPDFVINTSAIGRAFPDFSQGDSDESMSIEVGRGAKSRQRIASQPTRPKYSDNIDSPIVTVGDFQILSTPPMKPHPKSTQQDAPRNSTRKESHNKRVTSTQKENIPPPATFDSGKRIPDYVSGATRSKSGGQRRTLAEIHARVSEESDGSFIGDERPATVTFASKNSRFASFQPRKSPLVNVNTQNKQQVNDALIDALTERRHASQTQTPSKPPINSTVTNTINPTNQSFLLPNMPEISELVSGTFKDGTPVFTKSGKVQSRFSSNGPEKKAIHNDLDGISVPQEEKDIFLSLQLLQEKVATLEMEKADNQRILEDLQRSNYQLQTEKEESQRHRRPDSGLGMADSGIESENRKLAAEKTRLEAQLISLQNRLDTSDRKVSNQELRLKTNTAERDQAVKQLAEAFYNSEHLKAENDALTRENQSLKEQLAQFISESEENARRWQQKETALRKKVHRREEAVLEMREMTREIQDTVHNGQLTTNKIRKSESTASRTQKSTREPSGLGPENEQSMRSRATGQIQDLPQQSRASSRGRASNPQVLPTSHDQPQERIRSRSRSKSQHRRYSENVRVFSNKQNTLQGDFTQDNSEEDTSADGSFDETTQTIHRDIDIHRNGEDDHTRGSNYSSIIGHGEMDRLRNLLADAKAMRDERLASAQADDHTVRSSRSVQSAPGEKQTPQHESAARKLYGILKNRDGQIQDDLTGRLSIKSGENGRAEGDQTCQSNISHRRHSEDSIHRRTAVRHRSATDEMTSAFILPDITVRGDSHGIDHPALSAGARKVLDGLARHDGHNCTVCTRVASYDVNNDDVNTENKRRVHIEKPVPVSDRMPVAAPYEDEPTLRPATAPGLALVTVMKGLEDELAHLKMELAQYQAVYNKHNPSLGMRKRKSLKVKIDKLFKAIDAKADQIYALYDVLEGQKQSGQELSEKDVEITLQSIGVDVDALKQNDENRNGNSEDGSDQDSELDLPWEGIEDTTGTQNGKKRRKSWGL